MKRWMAMATVCILCLGLVLGFAPATVLAQESEGLTHRSFKVSGLDVHFGLQISKNGESWPEYGQHMVNDEHVLTNLLSMTYHVAYHADGAIEDFSVEVEVAGYDAPLVVRPDWEDYTAQGNDRTSGQLNWFAELGEGLEGGFVYYGPLVATQIPGCPPELELYSNDKVRLDWDPKLGLYGAHNVAWMHFSGSETEYEGDVYALHSTLIQDSGHAHYMWDATLWEELTSDTVHPMASGKYLANGETTLTTPFGTHTFPVVNEPLCVYRDWYGYVTVAREKYTYESDERIQFNARYACGDLLDTTWQTEWDRTTGTLNWVAPEGEEYPKMEAQLTPDGALWIRYTAENGDTLEHDLQLTPA